MRISAGASRQVLLRSLSAESENSLQERSDHYGSPKAAVNFQKRDFTHRATRGRGKAPFRRARPNGSTPTRVLERIAEHKINSVDELMPSNYSPEVKVLDASRQHAGEGILLGGCWLGNICRAAKTTSPNNDWEKK